MNFNDDAHKAANDRRAQDARMALLLDKMSAQLKAAEGLAEALEAFISGDVGISEGVWEQGRTALAEWKKAKQ